MALIVVGVGIGVPLGITMVGKTSNTQKSNAVGIAATGLLPISFSLFLFVVHQTFSRIFRRNQKLGNFELFTFTNYFKITDEETIHTVQ